MAAFEMLRLGDRRDGSARGLACDRGGVFLGGYALVSAAKDAPGRKGYEPRRLDDINAALSAAYGSTVDFSSRMPGLRLAARYLSEGKWALAQIAALQLRVPDLPDDAAVKRLRKVEALQRGNPNHFGPGPKGGQFAPKPDGGNVRPVASEQTTGSRVSPRDKKFLDKYYDAVSRLAQKYHVDPNLVLGLAYESGFGTRGTYNQTGDAFGLTGGSKRHMTFASSPAENVGQLFQLYGPQIYGTGSDVDAFLNALQGKNAAGKPVKGWRVYNSAHADAFDLGARKRHSADATGGAALPARTRSPMIDGGLRLLWRGTVIAAMAVRMVVPAAAEVVRANPIFGLYEPIPDGLQPCEVPDELIGEGRSYYDHGTIIYLNPRDSQLCSLDTPEVEACYRHRNGPRCDWFGHRRAMSVSMVFNAFDETRTLAGLKRQACRDVGRGRCAPAPKDLHFPNSRTGSFRVDRRDRWIDIVVVTQAGHDDFAFPGDPEFAVNYEATLHTDRAHFDADLRLFRMHLEMLRLIRLEPNEDSLSPEEVARIRHERGLP
jgi:hypothetical protein